MIQPPIVQPDVNQIRTDPRTQCRCTAMKHSIIMSSMASMSDLQRVEQCACADSRDERIRAKSI